MAGLSATTQGGPRSINHDIPLVPFIDFLLCLVMFLLATAAWSHAARVEANANVPGPASSDEKPKPATEAELHVSMVGERSFRLKWMKGMTVVNTLDVPRREVRSGGDITYPELAAQVAKEWRANGLHRSENDRQLDRAVLHSQNSSECAEIIAVLDAIHAAQRTYDVGSGRSETVPAFQVSFAVK